MAIPKDLIVDLARTDPMVSHYVRNWMNGQHHSYEAMLQEMVVSMAERHDIMLKLAANVLARAPVTFELVLKDAPALQQDIRNRLYYAMAEKEVDGA